MQELLLPRSGEVVGEDLAELVSGLPLVVFFEVELDFGEVYEVALAVVDLEAVEAEQLLVASVAEDLEMQAFDLGGLGNGLFHVLDGEELGKFEGSSEKVFCHL